MNGTASENHRASTEARRDTVSSTGRSGTDTRYDAMLRYLRGLYVRSPNTQQTTNEAKVPSQPTIEPSGPSAEPSESPAQHSEPNAEPPAA